MKPNEAKKEIVPTLPDVSRRMAKVRQADTDVELTFRRELHRRGLRYRIGYVVLEMPRRVADVVFPKAKIAVFFDGCFWHGCPLHATWPKRNAEFWREKIEGNMRRDADTNERLKALGWTVLRFWAHDSPSEVADAIERAVKSSKVGEKPC